jgi:hypothetical protein
MSLEQAIACIQDDELVEVTPKVVRIRKRFLDPHERKRQSRRAEAAQPPNGTRQIRPTGLAGLVPPYTSGIGFPPIM